MTPSSVREYAAAMRKRYLAANKRGKGKILDEFCTTTGYHRKAAIRLLGRRAVKAVGRSGRPRQYGLAVAQALKTVWEVSGRLCSKRLVPFMTELLTALERHDELSLAGEVREQLGQMSAATVDRLLRSYRRAGLRQPVSGTAGTTSLKAQIPIRTFGEWDHEPPGALQADLVAHCGESTQGFYLTTLTTVDVASGWCECEAVWGKGQQRVGTAVHKIRLRLPFALRELHTDNGGEFVNEILYPWCQREGIRFSRGRPYKKNDQAWVEQRNWSFVRRLIGYDRYCTREAYAQLAHLYSLLNPYNNFFQPLSKLVGKEREGAKVKKHYDSAQTPYQRLLASGVLPAAKVEELRQRYEQLNPRQLRREIDAALQGLWDLRQKARQSRQMAAPDEKAAEPGG